MQRARHFGPWRGLLPPLENSPSSYALAHTNECASGLHTTDLVPLSEHVCNEPDILDPGGDFYTPLKSPIFVCTSTYKEGGFQRGVVVEKKNVKLRICIDPKDLNKNL